MKVTAFLVDHGPVMPAFGYRVDHAGRSVVLSGDTRPSDNLVKFAAGADVLIHEALDPVTARARLDPAVMEQVIAHHTTGEQAGAIFARVKPRLAVFSHAPASDALVAQTRRTYTGPLEGAEDLLTIEIGDEVIVRRRITSRLPPVAPSIARATEAPRADEAGQALLTAETFQALTRPPW